MSIERMFAVNQLFDFIIMTAATRAMRVFNLKRVAFASALAALYGLAPPALQTPTFQLALLGAVSVILTRRLEFAANLRIMTALAVCASTAGAASGLLSGAQAGLAPMPLLSAVAGAGLAFGCARVQRRDALYRPLRLRIECDGARVELPAVVDTGNRLCEPLSGLPVLIACEDALAALPRPSRVRRVAYEAVGSTGTLQCFHPDGIYVDTGAGMRRGPEAWVALYREKLPCGALALAPAELVL